MGVDWRVYNTRVNRLKLRIFVLTFFSYAIYTATRLPMSITKSTLDPDHIDSSNPGYAPFNSDSFYLGALDTIFLLAYTGGLFISGPLGDRLNLRLFLGVGMILSGVACAFFGLASYFHIHWFGYFVICNLLSGLFQSSGWPGNVTVMVRWFGKHGRGMIMGIWNAQSSVGNIIGKLVSQAALHEYGWGQAFIVPALLCMFMGVLLLLFLIQHPADIDLTQEELAQLHELNDASSSSSSSSSSSPSSSSQAPRSHDSYPSIPFIKALFVPGVIPYSLCLFFSKFVAYAFIFWLPYYLTRVGYQKDDANNLSTVYDVGGVVGGVIAGVMSDYYGKRGFVSIVMLLISVPALFIYSVVASASMGINGCVMFVVGILVNGPYTLISSAVAADLGGHPSLKGNPKALSTVTGIIDGTGSLGAAAQGLMISWVGTQFGWNAVLYLLMVVCFGAACCVVRVVYHEFYPQALEYKRHSDADFNIQHDDDMTNRSSQSIENEPLNPTLSMDGTDGNEELTSPLL